MSNLAEGDEIGFANAIAAAARDAVTPQIARDQYQHCGFRYHGATWTGVDPPASRWISASVDCRRLARNGTWKGARYKRGIDKGKDKVDKVRS